MRLKKISFLIATLCLSLLNSGCGSAGKNTAAGAGIGAAAGAVVGAVVGHQSGNRSKGAAIGAALGGTLGGVAGHRMDKQAAELKQIAETKRTDTGLITKLKSDILFDTGKSELKSQAVINVGKMAQIMKKYPENLITIRGFTDATGSLAINQRLSTERAQAVKTQLIAGGVPAKTIKVLGMGPESPVGDNSTAAGRSQNRRVEIEITVDESKVPKKS